MNELKDTGHRNGGLTFFVKINNDIGDIITMVADLCVPCGLHPYHRGLIQPCNCPEYFCLPTSRSPMHEYVARAHWLSQLLIFDQLHAKLISDGLSHQSFCWTLRNDMLVQRLKKLRWRHLQIKVALYFLNYLFRILFRQLRWFAVL